MELLLGLIGGSQAEEGPIEWLPGTKNLVTLRNFVAPFGTLPASVIMELADERINRVDHPMTKVVDHRKPPTGSKK